MPFDHVVLDSPALLATGWPTSLTERHFPQYQSFLCPWLRAIDVVIHFSYRPTGDAHDLLMFSGPTDRGFSAYQQAGPRFATGEHDHGYVLDLSPTGSRLYRCDGAGRVQQLAADITAASPGQWTIAIAAHAVTVSAERLTRPLVADDRVYRGPHLWVGRWIDPCLDSAGVVHRADTLFSDANDLLPSAFRLLAVMYQRSSAPDSPHRVGTRQVH